MKKFSALLLSFALALTVGCVGNQGTEKVKKPLTVSTVSSSEKPYESLEFRKKPSDWKYIGITQSGADKVSLQIPSDWELKRSHDGEYSILRNSATVGRLFSAPVEVGGNRYELNKNNDGYINAMTEIREVNNDGSLTYKRIISFSYSAGTDVKRINIETDYSELSTGAVNRIVSGTHAVISEKAIRGDFTLKNSSGAIAVFGNSFVGTSQVGELLNQMFAASGSKYKALPVSRGYAQVSTYTSDDYYMRCIESGDYSAVFQCGLYSASEIENLGKLKEVCEKSGTLLVIFPAHNESASVIQSAVERYPDLAYVGWKDEVTALIENGVPESLMCIDDQHKHSTPLAGYVGAHMIYRALTGKVPPEISGTDGYNFETIHSVFKDYVNSLEGAASTVTYTEEITL